LLQIEQLTADASGKFLYVSDGNTLTAIYSIDQSTGALTEVTGSPRYLGVACIQASPGSEFLLGIPSCLGLGDAHMHVFSIDTTTGIPTEVSGSPFPTTASVFNFAISPLGQSVYTFGYATGGSTTVAAMEGYQMDSATGKLTPISGSPFTSVPTEVNCFFDQSGATMLCSDTLRVSSFYALAVDSKTGVPSVQATLPTNTSNPVDFMYAITD
jgi:6-phosphogluconolactonase (cycloisomerase 2 family)